MYEKLDLVFVQLRRVYSEEKRKITVFFLCAMGFSEDYRPGRFFIFLRSVEKQALDNMAINEITTEFSKILNAQS